jgi:hypothetical protein
MDRGQKKYARNPKKDMPHIFITIIIFKYEIMQVHAFAAFCYKELYTSISSIINGSSISITLSLYS